MRVHVAWVLFLLLHFCASSFISFVHHYYLHHCFCGSYGCMSYHLYYSIYFKCSISLLACLHFSFFCMLQYFKSAFLRLPNSHISFCWDCLIWVCQILTTYGITSVYPSWDFFSWHHVVFPALLIVILIYAWICIYWCVNNCYLQYVCMPKYTMGALQWTICMTLICYTI